MEYKIIQSVHNFFIELNEYLLNACDIPGTMPDTRDKKIRPGFCP